MTVDSPNWTQGPFYLGVLLFIIRGTGLLAHMLSGLVRNKPRHFGVSNPHSLSPTWESQLQRSISDLSAEGEWWFMTRCCIVAEGDVCPCKCQRTIQSLKRKINFRKQHVPRGQERVKGEMLKIANTHVRDTAISPCTPPPGLVFFTHC